MYLLKVVSPEGKEELTPECDRIFKTPLAEPGSWRLKLEFSGPRAPLHFTVPGPGVETIFIMTAHGDTIDILGKRPRHGQGLSYRRDRQQRRRTG